MGAAFYFRSDIIGLVTGGRSGETVNAQTPGERGEIDLENIQTTIIRPADSMNQVSAAGNIAAVSERPVTLEASGVAQQVTVTEGDEVAEGDLLVALDTSDLERAVEKAQLSLDSAQASLDKLLEDADDADIASAQADLASAQESLLDAQAGADEIEISAAEASLASAWAKYNDLLDGPSDDKLIQLSASMEKSFIALRQAQQAYDKIAYSDALGESKQAAELQQATIDYASAEAAYNEAAADADQSDLLSAWSSIQNAQQQLDNLKEQPTAANLASAEAKVASAASKLESLLDGADESDLRSAEINVEKAELDLEEARDALEKATLNAPVNGTVMSVKVSEGERVNAGSSVVALSDLNELELTVDVAEIDIPKIEVGQAAQITLDALSDQIFEGLVTRIAPSSNSAGGVVNYPVTVQLNGDLSQARPGMTAVAVIMAGGDGESAGWLVPTDAVKERNGQTMVILLRDGQPSPVQATKTGVQGEWTIVQSDELQAGDEALGSVSSFINEDEGGSGMFGGRPPGGGMGGRGGR
ncbi:MAG: hypothetical protein B6243_01020 [Anaerolineaceae bacterium 4572_5.2]|nr:MAG: hypothetical protein B6243_01020 [Anaerolineaceae bacterium 4572_5.2]